MIITITLVVFAMTALLVILFTVRGRSEQITSVAELQGKIRPVDILAFRNLVDPQEESYLRSCLPAGEFRIIQRKRMRAAIEYVQCVAANSAILLRLGEAARLSADPEVANAGKELVESASKSRILSLSVGLKLRARLVLPGLRVSPVAVSNSYENVTGLVGRLGRLQHRHRALSVAS
jgi:hypothetical protein